MKGILMVALLSPMIAHAEVAMQTTEVPGDGDLTCQLKVTAGWVTPGRLKATDKETGEVLIDLPPGTSQTENRCITAPDGHELIVLHPAFGTQYQRIN